MTYLLQFISFGFIFIPIRILPVGHPQAPYSQNTIDVVSDPSILLFCTGRKQSCNWVLKNKHIFKKLADIYCPAVAKWVGLGTRKSLLFK